MIRECTGFLGHPIPPHPMTGTYWQVRLPPGVFKTVGDEKQPHEDLCDACHRLWLDHGTRAVPVEEGIAG